MLRAGCAHSSGVCPRTLRPAEGAGASAQEPGAASGSRSEQRSPAPTGLLSFCVTQINGSDFQFPNSFPSDKCQSRYQWSQTGRQ